MLSVEALDVDVLLSVLDELVVDVHHVAKLDGARRVLELQCLLDGLLHEGLVEVLDREWWLVLLDQAEEPLSVRDIRALNEPAVGPDGFIAEMDSASRQKKAKSSSDEEEVVPLLQDVESWLVAVELDANDADDVVWTNALEPNAEIFEQETESKLVYLVLGRHLGLPLVLESLLGTGRIVLTTCACPLSVEEIGLL